MKLHRCLKGDLLNTEVRIFPLRMTDIWFDAFSICTAPGRREALQILKKLVEHSFSMFYSSERECIP